MTTQVRKSKPHTEAHREQPPKRELDKPMLKDLQAEPEKADKVTGGPAVCRVSTGC